MTDAQTGEAPQEYPARIFLDLRDMSQGPYRVDAAFVIWQMIALNRYTDQVLVSWHGNPHGQAALEYLREYKDQLSQVPGGDIWEKATMPSLLVRRGLEVEEDPQLQQIIHDDRYGGGVIFITKARKADVEDLINVGEEEIYRMIRETVRAQVIADREAGRKRPIGLAAEQFIPAWVDEENRPFLIESLLAARFAGVDYIVVTDTDGIAETREVEQVVAGIVETLNAQLPENLHFDPEDFHFHAHRDNRQAITNSEQAIRHGVSTIHVTPGGIGERYGNADLLGLANMVTVRGFDSRITVDDIPVISENLTEVHGWLGVLPQYLAHSSPFNAVNMGGMHASAHLKRWFAGEIEEEGPYAEIHPRRLGLPRPLVALSPVAGRSNVEYILLDLLDDGRTPATELRERALDILRQQMLTTDGCVTAEEVQAEYSRRQAAVLGEVKRRDFEEGYNYSGPFKANATLLVAKVFGVWPFAEMPLLEQDRITISSDTGQVDFSIIGEGGKLDFSVEGDFKRFDAPLSSVIEEGRLDADDDLMYHIRKEIMAPILTALEDEYPGAERFFIDGFSIRSVYAYDPMDPEGMGGMRPKDPENGDFTPVPSEGAAKERVAVTFEFKDPVAKDPTKRVWYANGVGDNVLAAVIDALQVGMEYRLMQHQLEQVREHNSPDIQTGSTAIGM